jgi:protein-disulfide isomerase
MKNKMFLIAVVVCGIFLAAFMYLKDKFNQPSPINQYETENSEPGVSFKVVPADQSLLIKSHSPMKGAFAAKVTVVEFLDPECESCSAMYPIVKKIYEEYKSHIRLVVRYMTYHKNSKYVANILEGARAENKYWEALELLFQTQDQWANHHNPNPELIPEILKPLKLNIKKIISDAKSGKYDKQIIEDFEDGKKVGVNGTPTFYVNGIQVQDLGYEPLKNEIEAKLNQK